MVKKIIILTATIVGLLLGHLPMNAAALMIQDSIISGIIWEDNNNNGVQEVSEVGIEGVSMYIQNIDTDEIFETETIAGGGFIFLDLVPGFYQLWYKYEGTISERFDVQVDELNGIGNINIPIPISVSASRDTSITQANVDQIHTIYLPIILR